MLPISAPSLRPRSCPKAEGVDRSLLLGTALMLCAAWATLGQHCDGTDVGYPTHVFKPDKVEATGERIAAIKAPPEFRVQPFATG